MAAEPLKFIANAMLGRLARWLRLLGCDVVYESSISDDDLIAAALRENRIILTMDRKLTERKSAGNSFCLKSGDYKEQIRQVIARYNIDFRSDIFTRCLHCNMRLESVENEKIKGRIPPYVYSTQDKFYICQQCKRVYWAGTHRVKILEILDEILNNNWNAYYRNTK